MTTGFKGKLLFINSIGLDRFYIPPEARNNHVIGYKSDIYCVGSIMCLLLGGSMPFETKEDHENNYYDDMFESKIFH